MFNQNKPKTRGIPELDKDEAEIEEFDEVPEEDEEEIEEPVVQRKRGRPSKQVPEVPKKDTPHLELEYLRMWMQREEERYDRLSVDKRDCLQTIANINQEMKKYN